MIFSKTKIMFILLLGALSQSVYAASFTVDNVYFSNLRGQNEAFKWNVYTTLTSQTFNLANVGDSQKFTYGKFGTTDFDINRRDHRDNNDHFRSNFRVTPPAQVASNVGQPDASCGLVWFFCFGRDNVKVNFDNSWIEFAFGNNGIVAIQFLDTKKLFRDGYLDLQARIKLVKDEDVISAVPVPPALLLMGSGLFGIAGFSRRRGKAKA